MTQLLIDISARVGFELPQEVAELIININKEKTRREFAPVHQAINPTVDKILWKQRSNDVVYMIQGFQSSMVNAKGQKMLSQILQDFMKGLIHRRVLKQEITKLIKPRASTC